MNTDLLIWKLETCNVQYTKHFSRRNFCFKPGQGCSLQGLVSSLSPTHSAPPLAGAGLVQVLVLVCVPPAHSAEHSDQSLYALNPPSTETIDVNQLNLGCMHGGQLYAQTLTLNFPTQQSQPVLSVSNSIFKLNQYNQIQFPNNWFQKYVKSWSKVTW